jgi:mandelate racemase
MAELVEGEPLVPVELDRKLRSKLTLLGWRNLTGMAVAGIEMAAWDALGIETGLPLATLLGARCRPVRAYDSMGLYSAGEVAAAVSQSAEAGFRAVKIKLGWPTLEEDLAVVRAARRELGDGIDLMVDYNQCLTTAEAVRRGRRLDSEGVAWIEEPIRADDFAGASQVAGALATPISIGENFTSPFEMQQAVNAGACDLVMPDPQQVGGLSGWLQCAALAATAGLPMSSHLFAEVSAHLLCAIPTADWLEYMDIASPVLAEPARPEKGMLSASDRPGFGFEWNEAAVERFSAT